MPPRKLKIDVFARRCNRLSKKLGFVLLRFYLFISQDMFQERARMSSSNEANTQRLMSALKDKETALKVRHLETTYNNCTRAVFN